MKKRDKVLAVIHLTDGMKLSDILDDLKVRDITDFDKVILKMDYKPCCDSISVDYGCDCDTGYTDIRLEIVP